jgi:hypothetical protein
MSQWRFVLSFSFVCTLFMLTFAYSLSSLHSPGVLNPLVQPQRNPDLWAAVRINMKHMSKFLGAEKVNPDTVICCVTVHKVL